ncbi:MAG: DNA mismatch repair protein MutS, partial [Longimicrobiales bacterium]
MQQWREAKSRHPDALVFFRVGDFYELFCEDAEEGARLLGLTLTSRNNGGAADVPLAGVPAKARDEYVRRLVQLGRRVAICEQVEDPAEAKGIVRREVVETITPGAVLADTLLSERRNNFLVAVAFAATRPIALAAADISTGELLATLLGDAAALDAALGRLEPAELLVPAGSGWAAERGVAPGAGAPREALNGTLLTARPDWLFDAEVAADELRRRFGVQNLDGFGFQPDDGPLIAALGALVAYVAEVQPQSAELLRAPRLERPGEAMALDEMTRRNLELTESLRGAAQRGGTLLDVVDETTTAMGARLLRRWLLAPLIVPERIWRRQEAVALLLDDSALRRKLREQLGAIRDLERLAQRSGTGRATPRELASLAASLA